MKTSKRIVSSVIVLFSVILLVSCSSDDDNVTDDSDKAEDPIGDLYYLDLLGPLLGVS